MLTKGVNIARVSLIQCHAYLAAESALLSLLGSERAAALTRKFFLAHGAHHLRYANAAKRTLTQGSSSYRLPLALFPYISPFLFASWFAIFASIFPQMRCSITSLCASHLRRFVFVGRRSLREQICDGRACEYHTCAHKPRFVWWVLFCRSSLRTCGGRELQENTEEK